jgi:hypothetical protein
LVGDRGQPGTRAGGAAPPLLRPEPKDRPAEGRNRAGADLPPILPPE